MKKKFSIITVKKTLCIKLNNIKKNLLYNYFNHLNHFYEFTGQRVLRFKSR